MVGWSKDETSGFLGLARVRAWHADELFVKMRGGSKIQVKKTGETTIVYVWNVMDRKTRFLLASKLSKYKDVGGADRAFREANNNAHGCQPERVFTDALYSYRDAVKFGFEDGVEHVARAGVGKPHANNNRIERLNGTLRERVKVQRGWKSMKTPLAEGQRIQYNFVKPHQALAGQTPAEVAGVGVVGKNKWLAMLTEAVNSTNTTSHS